jgi:hypothetical protein
MPRTATDRILFRRSDAWSGDIGRGPGVFLRAWVRLERHRLNGLIARGVERPGDSALALRELQLSAPREREKAARGLEQVLAETDQPRRGLTASLPIHRAAVVVARSALLQLAAKLRSDEAVDPRGVALASRLLTDGASPLYLPSPEDRGDHEALYREARRALIALLPWEPALPDRPEQ